MGHGIAQVSAMSGYNVVLRDIEQQFLDKAMEKIRWSLEKLVSKEKISKQESDNILGRIKTIVDLKEAVSQADLVIEAVPEIMDLKKKVYAELDQVANKNTVFASNTSTLPITEIANTTSRPERFIGIHFFNPPQLMKLVEVIPGQKTGQDILNLTVDYVKSVKKEPVICKKDVPGFIVNRLFIPMVHEACWLKQRENLKMEEIDSAVKFNLGFPMGIFELADFTGMDVIHKATIELQIRDKKVIFPHPDVEKLYNEKKFGQKSGEGFYKYSDEKYERVQLDETHDLVLQVKEINKLFSNNDYIELFNKIKSNLNKEEIEMLNNPIDNHSYTISDISYTINQEVLEYYESHITVNFLLFVINEVLYKCDYMFYIEFTDELIICDVSPKEGRKFNVYVCLGQNEINLGPVTYVGKL